MFGKRFAFQFEGPREEDWTPPWRREEPHGPRRGPFGFGHQGWHGPHFFGMHRGRGPFGPGGPFGFRGEGHRVFGRGDIKFALLELLQERPMYGYEMMKVLEEKSGGFYAPSPGSIYPTLQMLEDRGLVSVQEVEGKKVYSITDAGRALLAERHKEEEAFANPWTRWRERATGRGPAPELQALRSEAMEVMRLFVIAGRRSLQDPEQLSHLRSVIERTRKELTDMIYGTNPQQGQTSTPASGQSPNPTVENA